MKLNPPLTLIGLVATEPDVRDTYTNLRVHAQTLLTQTVPITVHGLVLVRASRYPAYHYGDVLTITARLEDPPEFEGFSYKDYLARQGVYTLMRHPRIERAEQGGVGLSLDVSV